MKLADITGTKKKAYLKRKLRNLKLTDQKYDFKKGYHPRNNILKNEIGDTVTDTQSILAR